MLPAFLNEMGTITDCLPNGSDQTETPITTTSGVVPNDLWTVGEKH
jgi:hypothetical protein